MLRLTGAGKWQQALCGMGAAGVLNIVGFAVFMRLGLQK
jgi:hypothetical protein